MIPRAIEKRFYGETAKKSWIKMSKSSKKSKIWRIVLDVLKPHSPSLPEFARQLGEIDGVKGVDVDLFEIDKETETLKVTIDGELDYSEIKTKIEDWGGVIHSVDEVVAGEKNIKDNL